MDRYSYGNTELSAVFEWSLGAAIVALTLIVSGCATQPSETVKVEAYSIPYRLAGTLGVGAGPVHDMLIVPEGAETEIVSRAIVSALQELELSIAEPELSVGDQLPEKQLWSTDRAPLDSAQVMDHNTSHPTMVLPPRKYEIQYSGEYTVKQRQLTFKISAQLYERALATDWRQVKPPYSGIFFVDKLLQLIQEKIHIVVDRLPT